MVWGVVIRGGVDGLTQDFPDPMEHSQKADGSSLNRLSPAVIPLRWLVWSVPPVVHDDGRLPSEAQRLYGRQGYGLSRHPPDWGRPVGCVLCLGAVSGLCSCSIPGWLWVDGLSSSARISWPPRG